MKSFVLVMVGAATVATAQFVPPPPPVLLTTTLSAVLPVLPTPFSGVETLQGAIIMKAPVNASYVPVNGPASVQSNLPAATYVATLPSVAFNELTGTAPQGSIVGFTQQGATGTTFNVSLTNLPDTAEYGPFVYHIHNNPVPADGNCTSTIGHFDPTNAGEYYMCNKANTSNCQAGDLAGKHGMATGPTFTISFTDEYLSTDPNSPYYFGSKSIVIHAMNTTRLTCANFMMATATNGTMPTTASPVMPTFTGAASKAVMGSAIGGLAALLAIFFM